MNTFLPATGHLRRALLLVAAGACHTSLVASPLEEVVVTSSRVPMPLREVGTSISVVTQQEITELGFASLYEIGRAHV